LENADTDLCARVETGKSSSKAYIFKRVGLPLKKKRKLKKKRDVCFDGRNKFSNTALELLSSESLHSGELHNPPLQKHHVYVQMQTSILHQAVWTREHFVT